LSRAWEPSHRTAVAARQEGNGATLVVGLDGTPSDLDPHSQYNYRDAVVINAIYDNLIVLKGSATDEFEGRLAESWEPNDDLSVWTFTVRPGVAFQDGTPCDSAAVKASFERLLAMNRGAVNVFSRFISDPAQMSTPDATTIVFDCGRPQPLFPSALASSYAVQIVNAKAAMDHEVDGDFGNGWLQANADGTGSGPYRLASYEVGQEVILERNDDYWRGWEGNHFDRVIIRVVEEVETMRQLVEAGEVDIVDRLSVSVDAIDELMQVPTLTVDVSDSTEVEYYTMTVAGPLASPEARQAMCYAFPYDEVVNGLFQGYASRANSLIAPLVRGYQENGFFFETDLDKAKELLAAAGVEDGTELSVWMGAGVATTAAQLFQANLQQIGITLNIEQVDQAGFAGMFYGDTPAEERPNFISWSWWPDYNDALNVLIPTISCDSWGSKGANGGFYCNDEVDALLLDAQNAATFEEYEEALDQIQTIITQEDVPCLITVQPKWTTVMQGNIEGFVFNPINLGTYDFWGMGRSM
jgi:peptide/nickel transport system substrate-binding protein